MSGDGTGVSNSIAARAVTNMHKTIILSKYFGQDGPASLFDSCYTHDLSMFICREACELLAHKKSPKHHYVATFSDEYSPGYRRVQLHHGEAKTKSNRFCVTVSQQKWIKSLGLKTLNGLTGHFYIKVTPLNKPFATLAQLAEQLICNQQVSGSTPVGGSNYGLISRRHNILRGTITA